LASLLIIVGVAFAVLFGTFNLRPNSPAPFVKSPEVNRWVHYGAGVFSFILGVGLLRRLRFVWFSFFAYITVSTIYGVLGVAFDPAPSDSPWVMIPMIVAFNIAFGLVVYKTTRIVFVPESAKPS
jgi:hypothetical protein